MNINKPIFVFKILKTKKFLQLNATEIKTLIKGVTVVLLAVCVHIYSRVHAILFTPKMQLILQVVQYSQKYLFIYIC